MNILVCVKQVFDDSIEIGYDEKAGKYTPDSIESVENAFDTYALEMAVRLKEQLGEGEITVLTIGPEDAKNALKNCLAVGADKAAIIISDDYQKSDTYSIANALSQGIKQLEDKNSAKFDIVFCGKETTDYTSGQVGIMLANVLNVGVITDLVDIEYTNGSVLGKHETETGYEMIQANPQCVVTVSKPLYDPRYATVKNKMAARKKEISEITGISVETGKITINKTYSRPKRQAGVKIVGKSAEEATLEAVNLMSDAKVI